MSASSRLRLPRLWIALFVLVPLAYNPVSRWQYEPDKAALALTLTALILGRSLSGAGLPRLGRFRTEWLIGGYLLVRLLTTALSVAPHWSLWGDPAYRNGLLMALGGAVLFGVTRRQLTSQAWRAQAVTVILISSAVVSGYGVLQYSGLDPFTGAGLVRVPSTLAHPNFLAAYLAMVMPLAAARLCKVPRRPWAGVLLGLHVLCLVFTYSRAGWLAALTGLIVFGAALLWVSGRRRVGGLLLGGAVVGFVTLFGLSLLPPLPGSAPHALQTLTSLFRWTGATAQMRLLAWQASLNAIQERLWLGYGPATFRVVLEWFLVPELAPFGGAPALGGRVHNVFLEVAVESGLVGLACYLAMIGGIVAGLVAALGKGESDTQRLRAAILGALAANLVTYLFSFESAATTVLFWSLAGMGLAPTVDRPERVWRSKPLAWATVAASVVLAGWMVSADVIAFVGESLASKRIWRYSASILGLASDIAPTPEEFLLAQGNAYAAWAADSGEEALWQRGANVYTGLVARRPDVAAYWQARGLYLRRWNRASEWAHTAQQAMDSYTRAIQLSPGDPDLWLDRGLMWLDVGNPDRALADIQQAGSLLGDYTRYYGSLSVYALAERDQQAAVAWQERALSAQREWDAWAWRR